MLPQLFPNRDVYDQYLAYDMYRVYLDTDDVGMLEELLCQMGSLVRKVYKSVPPYSGDVDTVFANTIADILRRIRSKEIQLRGPEAFSWYMQVYIKFLIYRHINSVEDDRERHFNLWERCAVPPSGRLPNCEDVENRLYYYQVRNVILSVFEADVRFIGKEKKACVLIASHLLGFKGPVPGAVEYKYGIDRKRIPFLIRYSKVLLRQIMMDQSRLS